MNKEKAISLGNLVDEYKAVGEMLLAILGLYEDFPDGVPICYNRIEKGECIAVYTGKGSYIPNVIGGYEATVAFQIAYKSYPKANYQSINAQKIADNVAEWLNNLRDYPKMTDERYVTCIQANSSIPYKENDAADGAITYVINGQMTYEK